MQERKQVLFINPPNAGIVPNDLSAQNVTAGVQHTDWANFPHLGILALASHVGKMTDLEPVYIDGVVCPMGFVMDYISENHDKIRAVCVSAITANFAPAAQIFDFVKKIDGAMVTCIGNDHFSAFPEEVLTKNVSIDYGFIGNEVFLSLSRFLEDMTTDGIGNPEKYPGLVLRNGASIKRIPAENDSTFADIDYGLLDRFFGHTDIYTKNFQGRLGGRLQELLGRKLTKGVPIEFARGCIKFKGNDACSFCSIQFGDVWKNQVETAGHAWGIIEKAVDNGYDYLYVTADDVPLTFPRLLLQMADEQPAWFKSLPENRRPVLVGYARADGMQKENVVAAMREVGFRICYVGVDAGSTQSLLAMNKPLRSSNPALQAARLFEANKAAASNATKHGICLKLGFVLGHIGMTKRLLDENVKTVCELLDTNNPSIVSLDVELLSPEPGSKDFLRLTNPHKAEQDARELGLTLRGRDVLQEVAEKYNGCDIFEREDAIKDYIHAFMPELTFNDMKNARQRIRRHAKSRGVVIGDSL